MNTYLAIFTLFIGTNILKIGYDEQLTGIFITGLYIVLISAYVLGRNHGKTNATAIIVQKDTSI